MSISQRFNSLLLGAFLCLSALAGLFIFQMGRVYDSTNFANVNIVPSILTLDDATRNFGRLRASLYRHLLSGDPARRTDIEESIREARAELKQNFEAYTPLLADDRDRDLLAADTAALDAYSNHIDAILAASGSNRDKDARQLINHSLPMPRNLTRRSMPIFTTTWSSANSMRPRAVP
jgi:methyl-accepting chemotaxis protein